MPDARPHDPHAPTRRFPRGLGLLLAGLGVGVLAGYHLGAGVPKDMQLGLRLTIQACEFGDPEACQRLQELKKMAEDSKKKKRRRRRRSKK